MHRIAAFLSCLLLATPAHAEDRPQFLPTKDVAILYRLAGGDMGNGAQKVQVTFAGGGQRERIDYFRWVEAKYPFAALIIDRPADRLIAMNGETKTYVQTEIGKFVTPETRFSGPNMKYTRTGSATIAGQPCTDWKMEDVSSKDTGSICVTNDGLILRIINARSPDAPESIALAVQFGTAPDTIFVVPPDFTRRPAPAGR